jgi:hypothetical protein
VHKEHGIGRIIDHDLQTATVVILTRFGRATVSAYQVNLYDEPDAPKWDSCAGICGTFIKYRTGGKMRITRKFLKKTPIEYWKGRFVKNRHAMGNAIYGYFPAGTLFTVLDVSKEKFALQTETGRMIACVPFALLSEAMSRPRLIDMIKECGFIIKQEDLENANDEEFEKAVNFIQWNYEPAGPEPVKPDWILAP